MHKMLKNDICFYLRKKDYKLEQLGKYEKSKEDYPEKFFKMLS